MKTKIRWISTGIMTAIIVGLFIKSYNPIVFGPISLALLYLLFRTIKVGEFGDSGIKITWPFLFKSDHIDKASITYYRIGAAFLWVTTSVVVYYKVGTEIKKVALEIEEHDIAQIESLFRNWDVRSVT